MFPPPSPRSSPLLSLHLLSFLFISSSSLLSALAGGASELYDLVADPRELTNLFGLPAVAGLQVRPFYSPYSSSAGLQVRPMYPSLLPLLCRPAGPPYVPLLTTPPLQAELSLALLEWYVETADVTTLTEDDRGLPPPPTNPPFPWPPKAVRTPQQ